MSIIQGLLIVECIFITLSVMVKRLSSNFLLFALVTSLGIYSAFIFDIIPMKALSEFGRIVGPNVLKYFAGLNLLYLVFVLSNYKKTKIERDSLIALLLSFVFFIDLDPFYLFITCFLISYLTNRTRIKAGWYKKTEMIKTSCFLMFIVFFASSASVSELANVQILNFDFFHISSGFFLVYYLCNFIEMLYGRIDNYSDSVKQSTLNHQAFILPHFFQTYFLIVIMNSAEPRFFFGISNLFDFLFIGSLIYVCLKLISEQDVRNLLGVIFLGPVATLLYLHFRQGEGSAHHYIVCISILISMRTLLNCFVTMNTSSSYQSGQFKLKDPLVLAIYTMLIFGALFVPFLFLGNTFNSGELTSLFSKNLFKLTTIVLLFVMMVVLIIDKIKSIVDFNNEFSSPFSRFKNKVIVYLNIIILFACYLLEFINYEK